MKIKCRDLLRQKVNLRFICLKLHQYLLLLFKFFQLRINLSCNYRSYFFNFQLLFLYQLHGGQFSVFIERCATCFLDQTQDLLGFHLDGLGNPSLHHHEMWVVDVKLYAHEELSHFLCLLGPSI